MFNLFKRAKQIPKEKLEEFKLGVWTYRGYNPMTNLAKEISVLKKELKILKSNSK